MIVRALDSNNDWTFGKGLNDYKSQNAAIAQSIQTRLSCFLGDCFFDMGAGINWFSLLGSKSQTALNLAINAVILNTEGVTSILQTTLSLNPQRTFSVIFQVQTIYSQTGGSFQYDLNGIA